MNDSDMVTCRRCGKSGDRWATVGRGKYLAFIPYRGYDRRGGFYMCAECSDKWLHDVSSNVYTKDGRAFIEYVEGKENIDKFFCPHCGQKINR